MGTLSRPRIFIVGLLGLLALAAFASVADASHAWGPYHWARTSNPFTLKLGDNVSSAWDSYLATTSSDWSASSVVPGGTVSNPKRCRPTSGRVEVCNAAYGNTGWLGVAQIWVSVTHITQGTVKVNDTYFNTATYNTPAWRNFVMCQEVGHTLGLDHQDVIFDNPNLGTCMDYTSNPSTNQHPNQHDYDQLGAIYAHLDSSTTLSATIASKMPPAMRLIDFATPAQWGRLVSSRRNGKTEVYELDFGRGHKVFTFVIWVEDEVE